MSPFKRAFLFGLIILALSAFAGCTTTFKKASKALEEEKYESAMQLFEEVLRKEPAHVEALAGLKSARLGYVDQKLLQVRQTRISENWNESLALLRSMIGNENEWKIAPSGKVAFTQEEEIGYAVTYAIKSVQTALKAKHPLKAESFLKENALILDSQAPLLARSRADIQTHGKQLCNEQRKSRKNDTPYHNEFVTRLCTHYGVPEAKDRFAGPSRKAILSQTLGDLKLVDAQNAFPEPIRLKVTQLFKDEFTKTAWYEPSAPGSVTLQLLGQFTQQVSKSPTVLVQSYEEEERYVVQETVTRQRQVPHTTADPQGRLITEYRTEDYTTTEPQEKTRSVTKYYRYPAWKHVQELGLTAETRFILGGKELQASVSEKNSSEGIEHDENQEWLKLKPSRPNLPQPETWELEQFSKLAGQFRSKASDLWYERHCENLNGNSDPETNDKMLRCLRKIEKTPPVAAEHWFQSQLGISVTRARDFGLVL